MQDEHEFDDPFEDPCDDGRIDPVVTPANRPAVADEPVRPVAATKICNKCGTTGLHWRMHNGTYRLFDGEAMHRCSATVPVKRQESWRQAQRSAQLPDTDSRSPRQPAAPSDPWCAHCGMPHPREKDCRVVLRARVTELHRELSVQMLMRQTDREAASFALTLANRVCNLLHGFAELNDDNEARKAVDAYREFADTWQPNVPPLM
jgi:hypothetical protein